MNLNKIARVASIIFDKSRKKTYNIARRTKILRQHQFLLRVRHNHLCLYVVGTRICLTVWLYIPLFGNHKHPWWPTSICSVQQHNIMVSIRSTFSLCNVIVLFCYDDDRVYTEKLFELIGFVLLLNGAIGKPFELWSFGRAHIVAVYESIEWWSNHCNLIIYHVLYIFLDYMCLRK